MVEILSAIDGLPEPVVELFYNDGPIHFLSVVDGTLLLVSLSECTRQRSSWLLGEFPKAETARMMTGQLSLTDCIRRFCLYRLDETSNGSSARPATASELHEDYLPQSDFRLKFTHADACRAHEQILNALGDVPAEPNAEIVYMSLGRETVPLASISQIMGNFVASIAKSAQELVRRSLDGFADVGRQTADQIRSAVSSIAAMNVEAGPAPAMSMAFRVVLRPGGDAETAKHGAETIQSAVRQVFANLDQAVPSDAGVNATITPRGVAKMREAFYGFRSLQSDVSLVAIHNDGSKIQITAPAKLTASKTEAWAQYFKAYVEPQKASLSEVEVILRGKFRTITSRTKASYFFEPDWEDPESAATPRECGRPKKISKKVETDDLAQLLRRARLDTPVQAKFRVLFVEGRKPNFLLVDVLNLDPPQ